MMIDMGPEMHHDIKSYWEDIGHVCFNPYNGCTVWYCINIKTGNWHRIAVWEHDSKQIKYYFDSPFRYYIESEALRIIRLKIFI